MIDDVPGVILTFDGARGQILLQRRNERTLSSAVENWREGTRGFGPWLAAFDWQALDRSARGAASCEARRSVNARERAVRLVFSQRIRGKAERKAMIKYLKGRVVSCSIMEGNMCRAVKVSIQFHEAPYAHLKRKKPKVAKLLSNAGGPGLTKVQDAVCHTGPRNIRHPWRG